MPILRRLGPGVVVLCIAMWTPVILGQVLAGDLDGDHDVDRNDLAIIQAAVGLPASGPTDPRDLDQDGRITVLDLRRATLLCTRASCAPEAASIRVDVAPVQVTITPGQTLNFATSVLYTSTDTVTRQIQMSQTVSGSGISITPALTSFFSASGTFTQLDNQTITAHDLGTFVITTTAAIVGLGAPVTQITTINVVEQPNPLSLSIPGTLPSAVLPNTSTLVQFSVVATGGDSTPPSSVLVEGVGHSFLLNVLDDGANEDMVAGDRIYSGVGSVSAAGMSAGQCLVFRARSGTVASPDYSLCASTLPIETSPSNIETVFQNGSISTVADELLVIVAPGTTEAQIQSAALSVGASVVGSIPVLRLYQFRISPGPATLAALNQLAAQLETQPFVQDVVVNDLGASDAVTPNDTRFGSQYGMVKIRADEAWTIARGGTTVAILDTGVDYTHPDLAGKVTLGPDYANGDADPMDDMGHGTHVAGIAAARSNNGVGVAGVAWNSPILAVKVLKATGTPGLVGTLTTAATVAQGIVYAANRGVRVMNMSLGSYSPTWAPIVCPAVAYARFVRGVTVVATAGNDAISTFRYPAACLGSIAVGSTDSGDNRSTFSNFGSWVSMAAPGTGIWSTVPTGTCGLCSPIGYASLNGTSMAAPHVAGAAAVLLSRQPSLSASAVQERLRLTARPLPGLQLGAGRIDLFEAVFNGSFEEPNMALWEFVGTVSSIPSLGPFIKAQEPMLTNPSIPIRMGYLSTGPAGDQVAASMTQSFTVQPGVTGIPLSFRYTFVTEEFPEFVGTQFNDSMTISIVTPSGQTVELARETVNASSFSPVGGINFPGGDNTVGWTTWKTVSMTIPVTSGPGTYRVLITDAGDDIYDSVLLIDGIKFR